MQLQKFERFMASYAIIATGKYEINSSEGEAIASFIPPKIHNIKWDLLRDRQTFLLYGYCYHWQIITNWLVYFRSKAVDIKEFPFNSEDFQNLRPKAQLLSNLLDLCAAVWEVIEIREIYPTPAHWWRDCILEEQQSVINEILEDTEQHTKGGVEKGSREFKKELSRGEIPEALGKQTHLYKLFQNVLKTKKDESVRDAWKIYLKSITAYTCSMKVNNDTKALAYIGNHLMYRDRSKTIRIPIRRIEKDDILKGNYVIYKQ